MKVNVDEKGKVTDALVLDSYASEEFQRNAIAAVKRWKFKPAVCDGKISPMQIAVEISSHIQ